jgi:hypothetical protein
MKLFNKPLVLIILFSLNLLILILLKLQLEKRKKEMSFYDNKIIEIKDDIETYFEKLVTYNTFNNQLFHSNVEVIDHNSKKLLLDSLSKDNIIVFFQKMECVDCLKSLFAKIKSLKINPKNVVLISDFNLLKEIEFFKDEFGLHSYRIYSLKIPEQFRLIKKPIIYKPNKNHFIFVFESNYPNLIDIYLSF